MSQPSRIFTISLETSCILEKKYKSQGENKGGKIKFRSNLRFPVWIALLLR